MPTFTMKPAIKILEKGLVKLRQQVHGRKAKLKAALKTGKPISDTDQEWLDGTGNLVDEERVFDILAHALNYEQMFAGLNPHDKAVAEKLAENSETSCRTPLNKHKCMEFPD